MSERARAAGGLAGTGSVAMTSQLIAVTRLRLKGGRKAECSAALMLEVKHYMCLSEEPRLVMLR